MSNAKWCDACGSIFPEGTDGSESGVGQMTKTVGYQTVQMQQVRDFCPECVQGRSASQAWRPRIGKGK